jgi:hypothetical protein
MPTVDSDELECIQVAKGKHVVPEGVAVKALDGSKKKLAPEVCPLPLAKLLADTDLRMVYDKLVQTIDKESNTRNVFGMWKDEEFISIVDLFRDEFAEQGVKVVLCQSKSGTCSFRRWLEFINVHVASNYVPQYDVENHSGQVVKTIYTTLEFPYGVAVEPLMNWGNGKKKLKEKMPINVKKMMKEKKLMAEYDSLIDACVKEGVGSRFNNFKKTDKLKAVIDRHSPAFEQKGVGLFLSLKSEYVSHGKYGGHYEYFRWLELVDRSLQPNYFPQRDAATYDWGRGRNR